MKKDEIVARLKLAPKRMKQLQDKYPVLTAVNIIIGWIVGLACGYWFWAP